MARTQADIDATNRIINSGETAHAEMQGVSGQVASFRIDYATCNNSESGRLLAERVNAWVDEFERLAAKLAENNTMVQHLKTTNINTGHSTTEAAGTR